MQTKKTNIRIKKSGVTSPIEATEPVLVTTAIENTEGQEVAVIDAPGVFLTADTD